MAWDHLTITKPHLVYAVLGGFTSIFMLCSSVIKERMYIGEATVATLCGLIFGPHAANWIDPKSWGNVDIVTIEFSRIVLVVQCFAVGVELPKFYMEKHWRSVVFLLLPVMTFGWLITSLFVWWMIPPLDWLQSLVVSACVTATDPVLASSVVGKGKFAKRVPKHLRDLLSAESGCNDGMAFPFVYLALYLILDHKDGKEVTYHWIAWTILYECVFGAVYGFLVGYIARQGIKFAEKRDLIDRESFLVYYFVLSLFCAGTGSILGIDDLLVGFACGTGFSNDGWFTNKTEESHVSNVIDLLINLTYFVYFGTIVPWGDFNNPDISGTGIGLEAWRLVVIAILIIFFRRIPIMLACKPFIPDIKTWREALFAGHFGPIGVGAIFVSILARAELEKESPVPTSELPSPDAEHYTLLLLVWPIVTFIVIASILVHGSSVAVFTLGKRINTLTITMSYTAAPEDGPSWMNRLPRISSQSRSQAKTMSDADYDEKMPDFPPGTLPPTGFPGAFLRRQKEDDDPSRSESRNSSLVSRRRRRKSDNRDEAEGPGGPISQSAIFPQRRNDHRRTKSEQIPSSMQGSGDNAEEMAENVAETRAAAGMFEEEQADRGRSPTKKTSNTTQDSHSRRRSDLEVYDEGDHIIVENEQGDVLAVEPEPHPHDKNLEALKEKLHAETSGGNWTYDSLKKRIGHWRHEEQEKRKEKNSSARKHEPARVFQFGNTIIVEDEDGEVVKKYELPAAAKAEPSSKPNVVGQSLKAMGRRGLVKPVDKKGEQPSSATAGEPGPSSQAPQRPIANDPAQRGKSWTNITRAATGDPAERARKKGEAAQAQENDDRKIRFTIAGVNQRMTKQDFIDQVQQLDKTTRKQVVEQSNAPPTVKKLAQEPNAPPDIMVTSAASDEKKYSPVRPVEKGESSKSSGSSGSSGHRDAQSPKRETPSPAEPVSSMIPGSGPTNPNIPSQSEPETDVERRRRMAVLGGVGEDDDTGETPAERRRRHAALGMSSPGQDSDSDDDDTPRVPPARRGIRFADTTSRGKM